MSPPTTDGAPIDTSVVIVAGTGGPATHDTIEAVVATASGATEVIVVVHGRAGSPVSPGKRPAARFVTVEDPIPFGAAANLGASSARGRVLCFVQPGALVAGGWLEPLRAAVTGGDAACAVPLLVDGGGGLVEAGHVLDRAGAVARVGGGTGPDPFDNRFPRRTDGGSSGLICVLRSAFVEVGGFDPRLGGLVGAGVDLTRTLRSSRLDTVFVPDSRVVLDRDEGRPAPVPPADSQILRERWEATVPARRPTLEPGDGDPAELPVAFRDADCGDRILVITGPVPTRAGTHAERRVAQLLGDLSALVPGGRVTLLALEGHAARRRAPDILRGGVEVVAGPQDWARWFARRTMLFSHVVVTDAVSARRVESLLEATQPQAHRILCLASLELPGAGTGPAGPPEEAAGSALLARRMVDQTARTARRFHTAWCPTARDRDWIVAAAPGITAEVIPTAAQPDVGHESPFEHRSGYVVLATPGADVAAGHEDAALHAARHVLPALVARDPAAFLRVVVDDPSPALQVLEGPNVELVPAGQDPARWFRRSRVCLAWYPRGTGVGDALTMAIDTRTPFVARAADVAGFDLGRLPGVVAPDDETSVPRCAVELHDRAETWGPVHDALVRLAEGPRSGAAVRRRLLRACAGVGIAPAHGTPLDGPSVRPHTDPGPALRHRNVYTVGSACFSTPPAPDGPVPGIDPPTQGGDWTAAPVNDQYRRWCALYGPTQGRLARLSARLAGLVRRPKISIVMPVFDTDPSWLHDAISSVRSQVYDNWELCIADDGSTNQATLDVLEAQAGEEARIRLVRLPGQQGIVGASNAALALATGEFVGFLDHDDELKPHALGEVALALDDRPTLDVIYSDEDKRDPDGTLVDPFFKPDWSPDHLMSLNYVCHFLVVRRALLEELGGFRAGYDGSQDYDLVLRATERTSEIAHIAETLYTWRKVEGSTAAVVDAKPYAFDAARRALQDALDRRGTPGEVGAGLHPAAYRVRYALQGRPKVSILIPTRDKADMLRGCIESVRERSTYTDYEIVVIDNQSVEPDTLAYLAGFPGRVLRYPHRFNYARMMNLAAHEAAGDLLLFLNNDTQVITPDWLEALIEHAQRPEVGIVGPRLLYPGGRPQHEGTIIGHLGGHAGNVDHRGYWGLGDIVRNCSAVTGACLMMRPSVYWAVGGHDERLRIAWNDVDLCLRVRQAGFDVVYTPFAELSHVEGGTRGYHAHLDDDEFFEARWATFKCRDPFYNPNLERRHPFRIRG